MISSTTTSAVNDKAKTNQKLVLDAVGAVLKYVSKKDGKNDEIAKSTNTPLTASQGGSCEMLNFPSSPCPRGRCFFKEQAEKLADAAVKI